MNKEKLTLTAKVTHKRPLKKGSFTDIPDLIIPLESKHVSDGIGYDWKNWDCENPIVINCPTGAGKNYFIENILIRHAIYHDETILVCSNRVTLDLSIKQRIGERLNLYKNYNNAALHGISRYGNIYIYSYQQLARAINTDEFQTLKFDYAVFDEVHYFTSDSAFSIGTGRLINKIPKTFESSVRIYMSATIDEILPYIYENENNVKKLFRHVITGRPAPILPKFYRMKPDYSHVRLRFYTDDGIAENIIEQSNDKSIIFVDNKTYGKKLHEKFQDSLYIDAETKSQSPETIDNLVTSERFEEKLLIATAVFENGCNICDLDVKNVFIQDINPTSILQMAGRRRILIDDDAFNLYIKVPDINLLSKRLTKLNRILELIELSEDEPTEFMRWMIKEDWVSHDIKRLVYVHDEKYCFDWLTVETLKNRLNYLYEIFHLIDKNGAAAYCYKISNDLFDIEFVNIMLLQNDEDEIDNIVEYLHSLINKHINITEFHSIFSKFKLWYTENFGPSKADNRGKNRQQNIDYNLFNNRLQEYNLPFVWRKENESYVLYEFKI